MWPFAPPSHHSPPPQLDDDARRRPSFVVPFFFSGSLAQPVHAWFREYMDYVSRYEYTTALEPRLRKGAPGPV